ncbi:MAG: sodium:proton antiporter, partial [Bacteroidota bacterium]
MEHTLKIDKLIPALLMMVACWTLLAFGADSLTQWIDPATGVKDGVIPSMTGDHETRLHHVNEALLHHFGKTA